MVVDALERRIGPLVEHCGYRRARHDADFAHRAEFLLGLRDPAGRRHAVDHAAVGKQPSAERDILVAEDDARSRAAGLPVAIHWSETEEELRWLEQGEGPFAALLGPSPRRAGLVLLDHAGLLGPGLALVHANHANPDERALIAARGACVVHCPGTHAFFARAPFDVLAWLRAGVPVALGSDSLASNDHLDLRRELARLRSACPELDDHAAWDCATRHGARALGLAGRAGVLAPGAWADLLAVPARDADAAACGRRVSHGDFDVAHAWIGGAAGPGGAGCGEAVAGCAPRAGGPG